jgi:NAD+ kinase
MQNYEKIAVVADDSPKAQEALAELARHVNLFDMRASRAKPDVLVVLGGDGFMLETLHKFVGRNIPVYGMNCGSVGFLLNHYRIDNFVERLNNARATVLHPLRMFARTVNGKEHELLAFNEVSLYRESRQAAKIRVSVDHVVRIEEMVCDGVLVSSPAGSTAYNFSAGGPIIPLGSNVIALTPLSPFRPRRWRGALLPHDTSVHFEILEANKRPVSAVADFTEVRDVEWVAISEVLKTSFTLLFDPEHNLQERIIKEQFAYA